jgi:hypothetical protein
MLNISDNSILSEVQTEEIACFQRNELPKANRMFAIWLIVLLS